MKVKNILEHSWCEEFRKEYVIMRVNEWIAELKLLTKIAKFYAQAASL